jgi:hypothetical protein
MPWLGIFTSRMRNVLLLLLIIAPLFVLTGVFLKVQHIGYGNFVMGTGLLLEVVCAIGFIARSIAQRKQQQ